MMLIVWAVASFLVTLTILVAIHEAGHFLVARWMGIKVLRFSIGFGRPLFSLRDRRGTEYSVAWIPLGGYVKMQDEEVEDEQPMAGIPFQRAALWRRVLVIIAGPLFNLIFAALVYCLVFMIGIKSVAPVIGAVPPTSIAATAGLKPLQEVIAVDGNSTLSWESVQMALLPYVGTTRQVQMTTQDTTSLKKQTHVLPLQQWAYRGEGGDLLESLGIIPYMPVAPAIIAELAKAGPAAKAGLLKGDHIIKVGKEPVANAREVAAKISAHPNETLTLTLLRANQLQTRRVLVSAQTAAKDKTVGYLGIFFRAEPWPKKFIRIEQQNPWQALQHGVKKTWQISSLTCKMLANMVMGHVSSKSLSGPIGIAQGAGVSAQMGVSYYLSFLALVSISLGIINLLPIPILDGGQLLYCLIEWLSGKPVSKRVQGIGLAFGSLLLFYVLSLAIYNDITRL
jgi:regulator of sigma E protease